MKIFISHSNQDGNVCKALSDALEAKGHTVFAGSGSLEYCGIGDNFLEIIKTELRDADVLVVIVTESFVNSPWAQVESSSVVLSTNNIRVFPVVVGDAFVPYFLGKFPFLRVNTPGEITITVLNAIEQLRVDKESPTLLEEREAVQLRKAEFEKRISLLKEALSNNQLTLVCGAGVSRDSSIPDWNELLVNIFNEAFFSEELGNSESKISAEDLLSLMPQSNLILGKYLKLSLKDDFEKIVQKHLYIYYNQDRDFESSLIVQDHETINYALETNMMKAIVELARPKRRGTRLESIITFNFDDIIECALSKHNIEYCSIWKEGQICRIDALPIFTKSTKNR